MKMINKDVLVTEIEKKRDAALTRQRNLEAIGQVTVLNELIANELNRIITFINTLEVKEVDLEKEAGYSKPASKGFTFKSIPRILEMVKPSERAKSYCEKLAKSLESEGYPTDAKIVRESIKMMNGKKVPMATMDEEPVSEDMEYASEKYACRFSSSKYGHDKVKDAFIAGADWQKEQFEKNRLTACDNMTDEEFNREQKFVIDFLKENNRTPTFSDCIEITRKQMIDKACEFIRTPCVYVVDFNCYGGARKNYEATVEKFKKYMEEQQ